MLGKRLKELRESKGLTQQELADIVNLSQQTIGHYEVGRSKPDVDTLKFFATYFGTTADYILGLTDDPTPPQPKKQEKPNFEEYVLSAPALGEALIRIAELDDEYSMDEPTFADLSQKAFKKFGLSKAKGADKAAGGIKIPGTGALDD